MRLPSSRISAHENGTPVWICEKVISGRFVFLPKSCWLRSLRRAKNTRFFILNLDPGVDFQEYAKSTLQIHSFHLTCKNTSAPGSPHPTSDGGICLVLLIKEEGLLACRVQYIKGDQAPVCKSDDKGVIRLGTAKQRL